MAWYWLYRHPFSCLCPITRFHLISPNFISKVVPYLHFIRLSRGNNRSSQGRAQSGHRAMSLSLKNRNGRLLLHSSHRNHSQRLTRFPHFRFRSRTTSFGHHPVGHGESGGTSRQNHAQGYGDSSKIARTQTPSRFECYFWQSSKGQIRRFFSLNRRSFEKRFVRFGFEVGPIELG